MNTVSFFHYDTYNVITANVAEKVLQGVLPLCSSYDALFSKTVEGSDVWRINHAEGAPVEVSPETVTVLSLAKEMYEASEGAFNIALGAVISLWKFTGDNPIIPDENQIRAALPLTDCSKITIESNTVTLPQGMSIDLGGIAKGYIVDKIAEKLREEGVTSGVLNFGGDVITIGTKENGMPWMVGLQNPSGERGKDFWAALPCVDGTVVTSGTYERGFDLNGVRYHHILDPRTGWPVQNDIKTVTIKAESSMLADALSTSFFVLGPDKGFELVRRYNADAIVLENNRSRATERIARVLQVVG